MREPAGLPSMAQSLVVPLICLTWLSYAQLHIFLFILFSTLNSVALIFRSTPASVHTKTNVSDLRLLTMGLFPLTACPISSGTVCLTEKEPRLAHFCPLGFCLIYPPIHQRKETTMGQKARTSFLIRNTESVLQVHGPWTANL